ncbi:MAG: MTH1187 family thiamine-binding protein [Actinomycetota bacterium]|nr:MTH1187 family thiamine-binding protein [Actinomycetota bacterium]
MLAAFSITPLGSGESVSAAVAGAVRLVRESGLPNETNAMFTNVEGEWDEVMGLIKACVAEVAKAAPRVSVVIKLDHRPGAVDALHAKVAAVESHLATDPP